MSGKVRLRVARAVLGLGLIAAIVPAALVYFGFQPVPTMIIPPAIAAMPFLGRTASRFQVLSFTSGVLLVIFAVLGGFSVGFFFIPSALAVLLAGVVAPGARAAV